MSNLKAQRLSAIHHVELVVVGITLWGKVGAEKYELVFFGN